MLAGQMSGKKPFKAISKVSNIILIILGCTLHLTNKSHFFVAINMIFGLTFQDEKTKHDALNAWRKDLSVHVSATGEKISSRKVR